MEPLWGLGRLGALGCLPGGRTCVKSCKDAEALGADPPGGTGGAVLEAASSGWHLLARLPTTPGETLDAWGAAGKSHPLSNPSLPVQ